LVGEVRFRLGHASILRDFRSVVTSIRHDTNLPPAWRA
jgi:hypothetical protein